MLEEVCFCIEDKRRFLHTKKQQKNVKNGEKTAKKHPFVAREKATKRPPHPVYSTLRRTKPAEGAMI